MIGKKKMSPIATQDSQIAAGSQKNIFHQGYLALHTPDAQVNPRPVMQGDPAGALSKQHLKIA